MNNGMILPRYSRDRQKATVATRNFLAAFGCYLSDAGKTEAEVLEALTEIDRLMERDDNEQRLFEATGIRLAVRG